MIVELSVLAALGAMFCWGFGEFFIQRSTRQSGDIESLAFIGIIGTVMLLPFVLPELPLLFSAGNLSLLLFICFITTVSALLNFEALKQGKLSVVETIFEIELPVTIILGVVFFSETISPTQLIFILLAIAGISMVSLESLSRRHYLKKLEKGVLLAILAAIAMGFLNFSVAAGARTVSPLMAVWMPFVLFTVLCLFFIWRREGLKKMLQNARAFKGTILGMGIFDTLAWVLFAFAVLQKELAITIAITESYPAVAMLLGVFVNKEKIRIHQYAGAALALLASIALAFLI